MYKAYVFVNLIHVLVLGYLRVRGGCSTWTFCCEQLVPAVVLCQYNTFDQGPLQRGANSRDIGYPTFPHMNGFCFYISTYLFMPRQAIRIVRS